MKPSSTTTATIPAVVLLICSRSSTITTTEAFVPSSSFRKTLTATHTTISQSPPFGEPAARPSHLWGKVQNNNNDDDPTLMSATNKQSTDPTPILFSAAQNLLAKKGAGEDSIKALALASLMSLALLSNPISADAAMSGGRMGGSYYSSSPSSVTRMAPTRSYSSSYSRPSVFGTGFASGFGAGVLSRPSFGYSPFYGGGGMGFHPFFSPGYYGGPGVISYSRGPGLLPFFLFGGLALTVASNVLDGVSSVVDDNNNNYGVGGNSGSLFSNQRGPIMSSALGPGTSVVQLSVALEVPNRDSPSSILSILNRLAQTARTDSRVGIQNLTSQVALELLRRKSSIVSASASSKHFGDRTQALRSFSQKAIQERGKFESETASNYGGVDYNANTAGARGVAGSGSGAIATAGKATMAVVTLLLNIDGDSIISGKKNVPSSMNSIRDVEDILRKIASDSKVDDCLQSAEILWTPEERSETLTHKDVIADYPELRSV